ncbi:MAG: sel1 repeat family protein [Deltaproteobacteria bacterium]|nr:sel1 repeat family protein [Deltaproteobacteria bacterium]
MWPALVLAIGCAPRAAAPAGPLSQSPEDLAAEASAAFASGDNNQAADLWLDACRMGHATSCHDGAWVIDNNGGWAERLSVPWFRRACDGGDGRGCSMLGLKHQWGRGLPQAPGLALAYFRLGCERGDAHLGCFQYATMQVNAAPENPDAWAEAMPLFERSCSVGNGQACLAFALAAEGTDPEAAARARARACELGVVEGCALAAP